MQGGGRRQMWAIDTIIPFTSRCFTLSTTADAWCRPQSLEVGGKSPSCLVRGPLAVLASRPWQEGHVG